LRQKLHHGRLNAANDHGLSHHGAFDRMTPDVRRHGCLSWRAERKRQTFVLASIGGIRAFDQPDIRAEALIFQNTALFWLLGYRWNLILNAPFLV
jgi:hypothetical protein